MTKQKTAKSNKKVEGSLVIDFLKRDPVFRGAFFTNVDSCLKSYGINFIDHKNAVAHLEKMADATVKHLVTMLENEVAVKAIINDCDHCAQCDHCDVG